MSLESLRAVRLAGKRPKLVRLIFGECPNPQWLWFLNDPSLVWIPEGQNPARHDLRPLVNLPVVVLANNMEKVERAAVSALNDCKAMFAGIAQADKAKVTDKHPWAERLNELAGEGWRELLEPVLISEWDVFVGGGYGINL